MSTPIEQIPTDPHRTLDEDQELVQSIIQEIKQHEGGNFDEEDVQMPPPDTMRQPAQRPFRQEEYSQFYEDNSPQEPRYQQPASVPVPQPKSLTLVQKLINESKDPLLVLVLYAVFGLPLLDNLLMKYIPRVITTSGRVGFAGVMLKGILLTIAFYIVKKLLK